MHDIRSTILNGDVPPANPVARKHKAKRPEETPTGLTKIAIKRSEARVTDQRCEDRHRDLVEECVIHFRRRKRTVPVINVSSRGAMIECDLDARIGERLDIEFADQARTKCVVRWIRGDRVGVEFTEETIFWDTARGGPVFQYRGESAERESGRSAPREIVDREPRHKLLRVGTLYWGGISIPVRLRNISAGGAKVESERELVPGAEVELDLGEGGFQMAEVRWTREGQIGLRFADQFDLDSLAHGALATAAEKPPEMLKPAYLETELRTDSPWAARFERLSLTDLKPVDREG